MASFADDFARGGGAELIGTGPGWQGTAGLWVTGTTGVAQRAGANATTAVATVGPTDTDHMTVTATLTRLGGANQAGIIARAAAAGSSADCYSFRSTGTAYVLSRFVGGTQTVLASPATPTRANGDVIALSCVGPTITASVNGAVVASVTDASITTGRYGGIRATSAATPPQFDNFTAADAPLGAPVNVTAPVGLSGAGQLAVTPKPGGRAAVGLSGAGQLTVTAKPGTRVDVPLSGTGQLAGTAKPGARAAVNLSGTGQLAATARPGGRAAVNLSGAGQLAAEVTGVGTAAAVALSGGGWLAVDVSLAVVMPVDLSGVGQLAVALRSTGPQRDLRVTTGVLAARAVSAALVARRLRVGPLQARLVDVGKVDPVQLSVLDCVFVHIPLRAWLADGSPAVPATVGVALLPPQEQPDASTAWQPVEYGDGEVAVLVAGSEDAADPDALVLPPRGADVFLRLTDSPEVQVVRAGRIGVGPLVAR